MSVPYSVFVSHTAFRNQRAKGACPLMRQELIGYNYCSALAVLTDAQDQLLHRSFWLAKKWPVPLYGISCCESAPLIPQYAWPQLKAHVGVEIAVKHENHTPI